MGAPEWVPQTKGSPELIGCKIQIVLIGLLGCPHGLLVVGPQQTQS